MPAPPEVVELVERFQRNRAAYHSPAYNETQVRVEFLNPLFKALGWDVENTRGYAEPYKDVVYEGRLTVAGENKAPDYSFRIGGVRKFFLEAKKPMIKIKTDIDAAFQLRRYAWSAKLPLSILSNFEEFVVYDCQREPKLNDRASVARVLYMSFQNYVEQWDQIYDIFSRDAILKGLFDNFAATAAKKRGTAEVDDAFLLEMESWRAELARNIALRNSTVSEAELNFCIQQTIDRIVFLRIAEDRSIEPYGQLKSVTGGHGVYAKLLQLFRAADDRYNSGLFHFRKEAGRLEQPDQLTPSIVVDDKPLKDIISRLYYPVSPYAFAVIPPEILGKVYEQFLGKVIRLTPSHHAVIEDKPEVRRAGGVYYTPNHVVAHIVDGTLGRLLTGKSVRQAASIRIVDPACGSGTFLLAAYQKLLDWHLAEYSKEITKYQARVRPVGPDQWVLTTSERRRILLHSIFGVDIDPQAVEVTKLSLLLRVLEGESDATITQQLAMFRERALPDLADNIKCGNAIVEPDIAKLLIISPADERQVRGFDWHTEFPKITQAGGFDIVIGNPPYDVIEKERRHASWPHDLLADYVRLRPDYSEALGGKLNLFRFFIVRGLQLARRGGRVGMIVPLSLLADITTTKTRLHLFRHSIDVLTDCFPQKDNPRRRIFRKAKLPTVVFTGQREDPKLPNETAIQVVVHPWDQFDEVSKECRVLLSDSLKVDPATVPVPLTDEKNWQLCLRVHGLPQVSLLRDLPEFNVSRGEVNQTVYRQFITGNRSDARLIKGVEIGQFEMHKTLSQGHREWFDAGRFARGAAMWPAVAHRRIATQRITGVNERLRIVATIVEPPAYFSDSVNSINLTGSGQPYRLEYLLGLLNSTLFQWRFKMTSTNNNVQTHQLESLPIRRIDFLSTGERSAHDRIVEQVVAIIERKRVLETVRVASDAANLRRGIAAAEHELNRHVFDLYALGPDEIALIEERTAEPAIAV